jgi:hypothetical protein
MARRKFQTLEKEGFIGEPKPVVKNPPESAELPPAFRGQSFVHKPNYRGRVSAYQPLFVPPGVKVAFRLAPQPGNAESTTDYKAALMEGWVAVTPEQVTDDVDKAKAEGLIALLVYEEINGQVRVGPYVLMWRPYREWYREYMEDIERILAHQTPGVEVLEETNEKEEIRVADE